MKQRKRKDGLQHRRQASLALPYLSEFARKPARPYDMTSAAGRGIGFIPAAGERPSNPDSLLRSLTVGLGIKVGTFDK